MAEHQPTNFVKYKKSKFSTQLPSNYFYTKSHFWVNNTDDILVIGLTKLAVRMLGELVECEFEIENDSNIQKGNIIGWIEGLKANSDLYAVCSGKFISANSVLSESPEVLFNKPYSDGWLYHLEGKMDQDFLNVEDYIKFLDETIEGMSPR